MTDQERELAEYLDRLADGELSGEQLRGLERYLAGQPERQRRYALGLAIEASMSQVLSAAIHELPGSGDGKTLPPVARDQRPEPRPVVRFDLLGGMGSSLTVMSVVALVAMLAAWKASGPEASRPSLSLSPGFREPPGDEFLPVAQAETLGAVSRLTRTSSLQTMFLPTCMAAAKPTLCRGIAWIDHTPTEAGGQVDRERGYLLTLPPKTRMQVSIGSDAMGPNSLGIIELDDLGHEVGQFMTFSNRRPERVGGEAHWMPIGSYTEDNATNAVRYFLLTATHRKPSDPDTTYRLSNYRVGVSTGEFLAIGWDDSSYNEVGPAEAGKAPSDYDFNDIHVCIRMSPHREDNQLGDSAVEFFPSRVVGQRVAGAEATGFEVQVAAGERVALMVGYHGGGEPDVAFQLCDADGQVVWRDEDVGGAIRPRHRGDRAFYWIKNGCSEPASYRLQVLHRELANRDLTEWKPLPAGDSFTRGSWSAVEFDTLDDPRAPGSMQGGIRVQFQRYSNL